MYWFSFIGQRFTWLFLKPLLYFFLRIEVTGRENLKDLKRPVIFAPNHVSEADGPMLPIVFNYFSKFLPIIFVGLEKKHYHDMSLPSFIYSTIIFRFVGVYPAYIGLKDYNKTLETHIKFLKEGKTVCIFPEGSRTKDGNLQPAKGGIIHLAKVSGATIVPVAIFGTSDLTAKDFWLRKRKTRVQFGKPILASKIYREVNNLPLCEYRHIADRVIMKKIGEMLRTREDRRKVFRTNNNDRRDTYKNTNTIYAN